MVTLRGSRRQRLRANRRSLADLGTAEHEKNEQSPAKENVLLNTQSGLVEPAVTLRGRLRRTTPSHGLGISPGDLGSLDFELPPELEAGEPPEARGLRRDEVRLMVSYRDDDRVVHSRFRDLGDFLEAGDVLVINTSATMNAAVDAEREDGTALELHLSTHLPGGLWIVELRRPVRTATEPFRHATPGERLRLPEGATVTLHTPYPGHTARGEGSRLWLSTLDLPHPLAEYLDRHGFPIRSGYVGESWPISYYQTVYATEAGSAEM